LICNEKFGTFEGFPTAGPTNSQRLNHGNEWDDRGASARDSLRSRVNLLSMVDVARW
jgi:hypothetical protein